MTKATDKRWIRVGINPRELEADKSRIVLYAGLLLTGSLSLMFAVLTLINLLWYNRLFRDQRQITSPDLSLSTPSHRSRGACSKGQIVGGAPWCDREGESPVTP